MKIALDANLSKNLIPALSHLGIKVVYHASNEPDGIWCNRALSKGAMFFASTDVDVFMFCSRNNVTYIETKKLNTNQAVIKILTEIEKHKKAKKCRKNNVSIA